MMCLVLFLQIQDTYRRRCPLIFVEAVIDELEYQWDHDIIDPESIRFFYSDWTKSSIQLAQDRARKLHEDLVRLDDEVQSPSPDNNKIQKQKKKKKKKKLILQETQEEYTNEEVLFEDDVINSWISDHETDESHDEEVLQEDDEDSKELHDDDKEDILPDMLELSSSSFDGEDDSDSTNNDEDFDDEVYDDYHTSHYHQSHHNSNQQTQKKSNSCLMAPSPSLVTTLSYQAKSNQQTAGGKGRITSSSSLSLKELRKLQIEQGSSKVVLGGVEGSSYNNCLDELPSRTLRLLSIIDEAVNLVSTTTNSTSTTKR